MDARLAGVLESLDQIEMRLARPSPNQVARILERRARKAAELPPAIEEPELLLVSFRIAGESYGVPLSAVSAVAMIRNLTPLPGVDPALVGLMNVRGRYLTAVDLGILLGAGAGDPQRRISDATKLIAVSHHPEGALPGPAREIALIAEEVPGLSEVMKGQRRRREGVRPESPLQEVLPDGTMPLDLERLFADPRLGEALRSYRP